MTTKPLYVNGKFAAGASNRSTEALLLSPCSADRMCTVDIYYVDTGRPKEDLALWRLDEKRGLTSAAWLDGADEFAISTAWQIEFAGLEDLRHPTKGNSSLTTLQYFFRRPSAGELTQFGGHSCRRFADWCT